ncbi:hypothetical protein H261_11919 [Paramagnetospirillum caucaseum]|uniref:Uncharacterized protein n=1 Tax=Paramagnetospirillum caucaseum TaxID=1244869 RepID=M2Z5Z3_9PROT|nr:hypothetical protein [Paramagnetospirillum caucaseum]EME69740.1 hypothetical protein H261_11919 [Paramagnetospirillum caucaseum]
MTIAAKIPTGPALRLHLIELLLPTAGRDVIDLAAKAEGYVLGPLYHVPAEATDQLADTIIRLSESAASLGPLIGHGDDLAAELAEERQWDAIIMPGDEPIEEADHDRPVETPVAMPDAGRAEAGDRGGQPPPAQDPGQEGTAQELTAKVKPARKVPAGHLRWTPERQTELRRLCLQGLEAKEIEAAMGLKDNGAFANAHRFGWTAEWREARERRRAGQQTEAPPPPAPELAATGQDPGVELPPPPVEIREPAAQVKPKRDYAVTVWAKERKDRLRDMVLEGRSVEEMAAELGLAPLQVEQQIPRQCLTAAWAEAKAAKVGAALAKPRAAPERPRLPEDAIRRPPEAQAAAPATIDTVADYLRGCGQTVGLNETGAWTIDGCALPPKRLLAAANQYRTANGLPPFSVRGL